MNIEAHSAALRRLAVQLVHDPDDLVQDTWVDALRNPPHDDRPQGPWLRAVLRNRRVSNHRAAQRRKAREQHASEPAPPPSAEQVQVARELLEHLAALPTADRDLLTMRYWEGLTLHECAERLEISPSTARSRHARALAKLRARLDDRKGGRAAWLGALAPWVRTPAPVLSLASISLGGVVASTLLWLLASLDPACSVDQSTAAPEADVLTVNARESSTPTPPVPPAPRKLDRARLQPEKHPCELPISPADSPTMRTVLDESRLPSKAETIASLLECERLHGPASDYHARHESEDGSIHPLLSTSMAMRHVWPAMRHCHLDDEPALARIAFVFVLESDGTILIEDVDLESSEGLDPDEAACVIGSVYVAEVDLRPGDPTMLGLEKATRLEMSRLVEVEIRGSRAEIVGSGVRPAGRLAVRDGFEDALTECGPGPFDVSLHWDPQTGELLDATPDPALDDDTGHCLSDVVQAHAEPLKTRFFPRTDGDTYQMCTLGIGAKPRCSAEPLFRVVEDEGALRRASE